MLEGENQSRGARQTASMGAKFTTAESFVTGQRIAHQYPRVVAPNGTCIAIIASERRRRWMGAIPGNPGDRDSMRREQLFLMCWPARTLGSVRILEVFKASSDWIALVRS